MVNLQTFNNLEVDNAYIITLKGNELSEKLSFRCQKSCEQIQMPYTVWDAVDGTSGEIIVPEHSRNATWLPWIKLYDKYLSPSEIACYMSHLTLWAHCMTINKPIVILEHDAVMVQPYRNHFGFNQIVYLGCHEQAYKGWRVSPVPPFGSLSENYKFMLRAHAYAIDPHVAKNLFSHTLKYGIHESLDVTIRADLFGIIQGGLYAYEIPAKETTIGDRKKKPDGTER